MALPDDPARDTIDRIVAICTTRSGVDLQHLAVTKTIQQVIDAPVSRDRGSGVTQPESNLELWTSITMPLKIRARR